MILGTSRLEESISVALRVGTPQNCHPLSTFPDDATAAAAAAAAAAAVNTDASSATFGSAIARSLVALERQPLGGGEEQHGAAGSVKRKPRPRRGRRLESPRRRLDDLCAQREAEQTTGGGLS